MELTATQEFKEKQNGSHSLAIHQPKQTGSFCFQFNDEEPFEIVPIYDNQEINVKLTSPVAKEGEELKDNEITFEKGGKKFRLFIKGA